jgi:outer membrane protein assembly factor BamB
MPALGYVRVKRIAELTELLILGWMLSGVASVAFGQTESNQSESRLPENPFLTRGSEDPGWRFIRGPHFDGHSPEINLANEWPAEGPPVLWTRELGKGYSAFVADRGRVYTQYQNLSSQYVICLDADTGATLWEHRYDWPFEAAGVYPGPRATPTLAGDFVYFASPDGAVGCLESSAGKPVWSRDLKKEFQGRGTDFGYACSPTVVDGLVVMPVGGESASLVALDPKTGNTVWKSGADPASYTPALPIRAGGKRFIVGYLQNALVVCELETGRQVARLSLSTGYDEHSAWPIYQEPHLWISGPFRGGSQLLNLKLSLDFASSVEPVWIKRNLSNDILSSVYVDGAIYGFDVVDAQAKTHRPTRGHFRCIDWLTGTEHWSNAALELRAPQASTAGQPRIGHASVIAADGKLFLFNDTGELILARANAAQYEELGRATVLSGEIVWTPPALHRGRLYLRNHSRAVCLYVGSPELLSGSLRERTLRVADVPQRPYQDWAATILGIEPEYSFDLPNPVAFRDWYVVALVGAFLPAILLAGVARWLIGRRLKTYSWFIAGSVAFVLGMVGTTFASRWRNEFVFTWPVCLFVAFVPIAWQVRMPNRNSSELLPSSRLRSGFVVANFLIVCAVYFLVCRRLSLVFEWAFLAGFPCALPFLLIARYCASRENRWFAAGTLFALVAAFSAFYWSSVALLWLRYL